MQSVSICTCLPPRLLHHVLISTSALGASVVCTITETAEAHIYLIDGWTCIAISYEWDGTVEAGEAGI